MFKTVVSACIDFVVGDKNYKTSASWNRVGDVIECFFVRSKRADENAAWEETSRGKVLELNLTALPEKVRDFAVEYGIRQIIADRNFAIPKKLFTKELERDRVKSAQAFLEKMFELGEVPMERVSGGAKSDKERLTEELAVAIDAGDFARAGEITAEMKAKGYVLTSKEVEKPVIKKKVKK